MDIEGKIRLIFSEGEYQEIHAALSRSDGFAAMMLENSVAEDESNREADFDAVEALIVLAALRKSGYQFVQREKPAPESSVAVQITPDTLNVLKDAVGKPVTIRELSNLAGIRYNSMRNLLAELAGCGALVRKGKTITRFDFDAANRLIFK